MRNYLTGIILITFLALFSGCRTFNEKRSVYIPRPSITSKAPLVKSLLVEKVINEQPSDESLPFNPNNDPWILIPFCFYSSEKVDPVIKRNFFQNNLDEAMQRLIIKDLRASGIAENVTCSDILNAPGACKWKNKYRLVITLQHAVWNRNITAYGLSYPGTFLWVFAFPVSYGNVEIELEAKLFPPGKSTKPLATRIIKREHSCTELIYDQVGYQSSVSERILVRMFPEIVSELRDFVYNTLKQKK